MIWQVTSPLWPFSVVVISLLKSNFNLNFNGSFREIIHHVANQDRLMWPVLLTSALTVPWSPQDGLGSMHNPTKSCDQMFNSAPGIQSGVFWLEAAHGGPYQVCSQVNPSSVSLVKRECNECNHSKSAEISKLSVGPAQIREIMRSSEFPAIDGDWAVLVFSQNILRAVLIESFYTK